MKKVLPNNAKTKAYLESLPKIYLIGCWAGFGIMEFRYAKKWDEFGIPYVWQYEDFNGTCDEFHLRKITDTTTGTIYGWTPYLSGAKKLVKLANEAQGEAWRNE